MRILRPAELQRLSPEAFRAADKHPFWVALDDIRSVLNVGSIFRSVDAFRGQGILLGGTSPEPSREMNKTALGATECVHWEKPSQLDQRLLALKQEGYRIMAVELTSHSESLHLWQSEPSVKGYVFVFGHEVTGVSPAVLSLCDGALSIAQYGTKHSLNVAVSAGIALHHFVHQLPA